MIRYVLFTCIIYSYILLYYITLGRASAQASGCPSNQSLEPHRVPPRQPHGQAGEFIQIITYIYIYCFHRSCIVEAKTIIIHFFIAFFLLFLY